MRIVAVNASPRKHYNSDKILDRFLDGVRDTDPSIEVEKVHLYDEDFKGCRSCYACLLKTSEQGHCLYRDGGTDLIRRIKTADGFVFSAPVYYFEVPAQMRALLERIWFPGPVDHEVPVAALYTMNQPEGRAERLFEQHLDDIGIFLQNTFQTIPDELWVYNTLHLENPEPYRIAVRTFEDKVAYKAEHFENDLHAAYEAGVRMATKLR